MDLDLGGGLGARLAAVVDPEQRRVRVGLGGQCDAAPGAAPTQLGRRQICAIVLERGAQTGPIGGRDDDEFDAERGGKALSELVFEPLWPLGADEIRGGGVQRRYPQLQVLRRSRDAGGGKSGALNALLPQLQGRWLLVLDADAQLQPDGLKRLVAFAEAGGWSAVQLRKAVVNADHNLLTRAQAMEMALDAVIQQGRLHSGGVVELRGNGQLLQRQAVLACDGFNEATVTDDLDLSFRLLVQGQPVGLLWNPPIQEEAVTSVMGLWRQRQRWAEGGLQRFFDYWGELTGPATSAARKLDLSGFFLLQYALPVMAVADLFTSLLSRGTPLMWPLSFVAFGLSGGAILVGCLRRSEGPALPRMHPLNLALGIAYLGHWFVVIPYTTLRMALLPKRLVWAKTLHVGSGQSHAAEESDLTTQVL